MGEAVVDLTRAQVPVFALEPSPVVESRGIAERKALQELTTCEAGCTLELVKQAAVFIFWHGQCRVSRGARQPPGFVEGVQIEFDIGGEIKTEGVACDGEVRHMLNTSTLTQ